MVLFGQSQCGAFQLCPSSWLLRSTAHASDPQQSAGHTVDRTNPELDSFSIDINAATITLSFSETVNARSYDPTKLTIMSNANSTDATFTLTLTGGAVTSPTDLNSSIVTVSIDTADLDDLKLAYSAVTSTADTFVSLATGLINDMTDRKQYTFRNIAHRRITYKPVAAAAQTGIVPKQHPHGICARINSRVY